MDWTTIQSAIVAWVVAGSGLAADRVIWTRQGGDRPPLPFIELDMAGVPVVGQDWYQVDENAGSPLYVSRGSRVIVLQLQAFGAAAVGSSSPKALLEKVKAAAGLPSNRAALNAAKVSVSLFEAISEFGVALGGVTEPRATTACRLHATSQITEPGNYIETVNLVEDPPIS